MKTLFTGCLMILLLPVFVHANEDEVIFNLMGISSKKHYTIISKKGRLNKLSSNKTNIAYPSGTGSVSIVFECSQKNVKRIVGLLSMKRQSTFGATKHNKAKMYECDMVNEKYGILFVYLFVERGNRHTFYIVRGKGK